MTLEHDIFLWWRFKHGMTPYAFNQKGGGRYILTIDGHPIEYQTINTEPHTILILAGNRPETSPCFSLELNRKANTAILQDVVRRPACFKDSHPDSRNLVRAAYIIAQRRGSRSLELTDKSHIYCPQYVQLADLSFLTTGQTWYESILPINCTSGYPLEEARALVRTNTWRTVGHDLAPIDVTGVDIDAPGSAMIVLAALKESKQYCWFFSKYMGVMLVRSGIDSLFGTKWQCGIVAVSGSNTRRRTRKRQS
jgi:hypothetical protein